MDERTALAATAARGVRDGRAAVAELERRRPRLGRPGRARRRGRRGAARRASSPRGPGMRCSASRRASRRWRGSQAPSLRAARWTVVAVGPRLRRRPARRRPRPARAASTCWRRRCGACCAWNALRLPRPAGLAAACSSVAAAATARGPIVRGAGRAASRRRIRLPRLAAGGSAAALHRFAALWLERSRGLATRRAETLLHAAAAALALGLIAGLYLRGLVFDYRVGWQSTFLDARGRARRRHDAAGAGGAAVGHRPARRRGVRGDAHGATARRRRRPGGAVDPPAGADAGAGGGAAARAARAAGARRAPRWRAPRFPLPLEQPYYQRLARLQRGGSAKVVVFPYGARRLAAGDARPARAARRGVRAAGRARRRAAAWPSAPRTRRRSRCRAGTSHAIALFDLSATPETENQGRFLRRLAAALPAGAALAVLLDESQFARRFAGLGDRLAQRREAWRLWGEAHGSVGRSPWRSRRPAAADAPARLQAAFAAPASPSA